MSFWEFWCWNLVPFLPDISCWRVCGRLWRIFHLMMRQMFSIGKRKGGDLWPSMVTHTRNLCSAFNPSKKCSAFNPSTHTVNTHPEQLAANAAAPGEQLGVQCLAQGSHLRPRLPPFYRWKIWTAGRPIQRPDSSTMKPCCCKAAVCGFALSCWNTHGLPWNRRRLEGSICCSKTFIYLSAFIVPSKTCKLPIPYALMHPHTIRDAGFWTEHW